MATSCSISDGHPIDLGRLLETRMLVQANSGGGKSWALRRILEQTAPKVQQLVIDPEGEFSTLREKFDYVICAPHDADAIASPRTAALLARRLLETGVSAILDIYDLKAHERQAFVEKFLTALVNAPKALWHPVLIVLDEAHVFAPEKGSAESTGAVIDLATRGRKRGQSLIVATQRLAKLHKDVAAEMLNKLIGRTGLDVDVKRAADELGMTPREAMEQLRPLSPGEFYIFGPALSLTVEKIAVGDVATTHPKAGARLLQAPPAPSTKIKGVLAELADLPQQAESEIRTLEDLKRENANLKRSLTVAQKAQPVVESAEVPKLREEAKALRVSLKTATDAFKQADARLRKIAALADVQSPDIAAPPPTSAPAPRFQPAPTPPRARANGHAEPQTDVAVGAPERRVLTVLAQYGPCSSSRLALLSGYSYSGGFRNILSALRTAGLITGQNTETMSITDEGLALGPFDELPTGEALRQHWLNFKQFGTGERKVLQALLDNPDGLDAQQLCSVTDYEYSGGFRNILSALRAAGVLVGKNGQVMRASDELLRGA
jgi:hypothetical protein